jgi:hypothetical protein
LLIIKYKSGLNVTFAQLFTEFGELFMFRKIRSLIGLHYFRKELEKTGRNRKLTNLKDAKKIGILYNLDNVPDYDVVAEFVTRLQHERKEVKALGYVKNKNLISRFLPKLSYDFFSGKDMNWFYKPVKDKVMDFIQKDFDLLIDLDMKDSLPLKYISGLSMSMCRIGRYSEDNASCYDLMLDVNPSTPVNEFIRQITHYLTIINNDGKASG